MTDEAHRLLSGETWRLFCDRLKAAGDRLLESDFPSDEQSRAEGFRSLTRLMASATEFAFETANPAFPDFIRDQGPRSQWGGANPDFVTLRSAIDPAQSYKIWADIDGLFQASFSQHQGSVAEGQTRTYYERHLESFEVDEDGFLELILSPDEHDGNWIPSHADARFFTIRIVVSDWEVHTAPTFHIERIGAEGQAPPPPTAAEIARGLEGAITWIEKSSIHWPRFARAAAEHQPANVASPLVIQPGDPNDMATGRCCWDLTADEALVLICEVPLAQYWGFSIQTTPWLDAGDYPRRQTSLSGDQIHLDEDGLARLVLCTEDPGVPNWIDTEGRARGILAYRFGWAETLPIPDVRLVGLDEVRRFLPEDHPVVTGQERRDQLSLRREALWNRFG
jgi:hypothetical protein